MSKAKEISALYKDIKQQMGKLVSLCHEVEDHAEATEAHAEVTADAYQRGYENGFVAGHLKAEKSGQSFYEDGYQRGLSDAWDAARKISDMYAEERRKVFGENFIQKIHSIYTASECIEKIRQYEQEQEEQIQVGDEVIYNGTITCVVFSPENDKRYASIIDADGIKYSADHRELTKTGRHFPEIAEVLRKMKESDNG